MCFLYINIIILAFQENIKANKLKIGALSEVKEELATQLQERN